MVTTLLALALGFIIGNIRIFLIAAMAVAFIAQPVGFITGAAGVALLLRRVRRPP